MIDIMQGVTNSLISDLMEFTLVDYPFENIYIYF